MLHNTSDKSIHILSQEFQKLKIKKKPRQKKYLISSDTRNFLQSQKDIYIGIIPFRSINLPIHNPKKELFMHQTEVITEGEQMIQMKLPRKKISNIPAIISEYITNLLGISISQNQFHKILEVENSKIHLFALNISHLTIQRNNIKKKSNIENLCQDIDNISLQEKINPQLLVANKLKIKKILDFYTQIEVRKSVRELYQNITNTRQNKNTLVKCIPFRINEQHVIQFKYYGIYTRLS